MYDEGASLARLALGLLVTCLCISFVVAIPTLFFADKDITVDTTQKVESDTAVDVSSVSISTKTFDVYFYENDNERVTLNYNNLSSIARHFYEETSIQLYVLAEETDDDTQAATLEKAKKVWMRDYENNPYCMLLYITDNGDYWFEGSYVYDFTTSTALETFKSQITACYSKDMYKTDYTLLFIIVSVIVLVAVGYFGYKVVVAYLLVRKQKQKEMVELLSTPVVPVEDVDKLLAKYTEESE